MSLSKAFVDFAALGAEWVLWLLIGLSVISIGVMIDRYLWFRDRDRDTERFLRELRGAFERNEVDRTMGKYKEHPAIPIQVAMRGIAERDKGPQAVAEAMHQERAHWRTTGDRGLIILGTLGNNVPFVGLFGTVLGVMNAFSYLSQKTAAAEEQTLHEIREALAATAFGLLVAIPAVVAFNYFTRRLKVVMSSADVCAHQVLALVHGKASTAARSAGASDPMIERVVEAEPPPVDGKETPDGRG
jgi:biopolymer transport protein ExbB/TolQ